MTSADATALAEQQRTNDERGAAAAMRGDRPPLPQQRTVSVEAAAEQLLAAEDMLRANPAMEGVKCAHVEALILCRKYDAALKACTSLLSHSVDALYIKAEAQWRAGKPDAALETLRAACIDESAACKCGLLATFLKQLLVRAVLLNRLHVMLTNSAQAAFANGEQAAAGASAETAISSYGRVLALEPVEGTHMQVCL